MTVRATRLIGERMSSFTILWSLTVYSTWFAVMRRKYVSE